MPVQRVKRTDRIPMCNLRHSCRKFSVFRCEQNFLVLLFEAWMLFSTYTSCTMFAKCIRCTKRIDYCSLTWLQRRICTHDKNVFQYHTTLQYFQNMEPPFCTQNMEPHSLKRRKMSYDTGNSPAPKILKDVTFEGRQCMLLVVQRNISRIHRKCCSWNTARYLDNTLFPILENFSERHISEYVCLVFSKPLS